MHVNFLGYGENVATFIADASVTGAGIPVKVSGDGTVSACSTNDVFCGVCVGVRGGYAAVQLAGYAELPAAAKIDPGYQTLAVNSAGKAAVNENGRSLLVVQSTATSVGVIL